MSGIWTSLKRLLGAPTSGARHTHAPPEAKDRTAKPILSQQELAREIRSLVAGGREPSEQELLALQDRFSRNMTSELPHFIGHWFADADIRRRDAEYSEVQASQLEEALKQMEGAHVI